MNRLRGWEARERMMCVSLACQHSFPFPSVVVSGAQRRQACPLEDCIDRWVVEWIAKMLKRMAGRGRGDERLVMMGEEGHARLALGLLLVVEDEL
jgi:hypothetical protein